MFRALPGAAGNTVTKNFHRRHHNCYFYRPHQQNQQAVVFGCITQLPEAGRFISKIFHRQVYRADRR